MCIRDRPWSLRSALFLAPLFALPLTTSSATAQSSISNGATTLFYDAADPDFGLVFTGVGDTPAAAEFSFQREPLWELLIQDPVNPAVQFVLSPDRTAGATFELVVLDEDPDELKVSWVNVTNPTMPNGQSVTVTLKAEVDNGWDDEDDEDDDDDGEFEIVELELTVVGTPFEPRSALRLSFPMIEIVGGPNPASEMLAVPYWNGTLFDNPINNSDLVVASLFLEPEVHPGPLNLQFLAFYDSSPASDALLFWGTRDAGGTPKGYRVDPNPFGLPPTLGLSIEVAPREPILDALVFSVPYRSVLGVLRGDWYDAARYYRESWALSLIHI